MRNENGSGAEMPEGRIAPRQGWPAELLTAAQMRAVEAEAMASGAVTGLELMERAGVGVVEAIFETWPELGGVAESGQERAGQAGRPQAGTPTRTPTRTAVILCGPGNNGGDGFVIARLLHQRGWAVEVFLYGDPDRLPPDAQVNHDRWVGMGEVAPLTEAAFRDSFPAPGHAYADLYVDAIFGAGLSRPLEGEARAVLTHMSGRNGDNYTPYTVAIDAPSGLCLDSGKVLGLGHESLDQGSQAMAALTVTFETAKPGHFLGLGPACCGKLVVKPIGIWPWRKMEEPKQSGGHWLGHLKMSRLNLVGLASDTFNPHDPLQVAQISKGRLDKWASWSQHKFGYGHALVLSGPSGAGGAARLAARSALRVGAGLVTLACPPEAIPENAARLDAVMLKALPDAEALTALLSDPRIGALALGPGLGLDDRAAGLVRAALEATRGGPRATGEAGEGSRSRVKPGTAGSVGQGAAPGAGGEAATERREDSRPIDAGRGSPRRPLVLDADALTLIARDPALFPLLHEACVLTPHGGEFARLFPDIAERMAGPQVAPVPGATANFAEVVAWSHGAREIHAALQAERGPAFSKVDASREAAARAGCTVLYKGPDTVIASPDGTCAIHAAVYDRAAPWLATAGSGDVLAGLITGLLARGFQPQSAAETGAWLHVEAARIFGPGLIAEDLPEMIPKVFRVLGL